MKNLMVFISGPVGVAIALVGAYGSDEGLIQVTFIIIGAAVIFMVPLFAKTKWDWLLGIMNGLFGASILFYELFAQPSPHNLAAAITVTFISTEALLLATLLPAIRKGNIAHRSL